MIEQGKELRLENVLSLRKKIAQNEIINEMMKIGQFLKDNGLRKVGPVVTTTFAVGTINGQPVLDMEILVPIDREATVVEPYTFKKLFDLKYAVYARYEGSSNLLQNTINQMLEFIKVDGLTQITSVYSVNIKELKQGDSLDNMVTDLYIGVNPSVL